MWSSSLLTKSVHQKVGVGAHIGGGGGGGGIGAHISGSGGGVVVA